ncbi:MAG TPA: hypothetical protein VNQ32_15040 [Steroidobacteraceae bacterium]|nr:hypothetical protein [Steroidobacteraceae bacterium]
MDSAKPISNVSDAIRNLYYARVDTARAVMYSYIFRPAAYFLPVPVIGVLAGLGAAVLVLLDGFGSTGRQYRTTVGSAMQGIRLYWLQQARRFFEHSWQHMIIAGKDPPGRYRFRVECSEAVRQIMDGTESFVLASGHFLRGPATLGITVPEVGRRRMFIAFAEPPSAPRDAHEWRIAVQLKLTLRSTKAWSPKDWVQAVYRGRALAHVLSEMRKKPAMLFVNVDAHWSKGHGETITVPFAGFAARTFSTGAARAARLVGCPLLLMIPTPAKGRDVTIRILGPYTSEQESELERDAEIMKKVLKDVEAAIAEFPDQYVLELGRDRPWR